MTAIEIYTKILGAIGEAAYSDSSVAIEFAQRKLNSDHYAKQNANTGINQGDSVSQGIDPAYPTDYHAKAQAEARAVLRAMIKEEIAAVRADNKLPADNDASETATAEEKKPRAARKKKEAAPTEAPPQEEAVR